HRSGDRIELPSYESLDAVVEKNASDMGFGLALGEFEARVLELDQRLTEHLAFFHVLHGHCDRDFCRRHCAHRNREPLVRQLLHHLEESVSFRTEEVCDGDPYIFEEKLARVLSVHADFFEWSPDVKTCEIVGL